MPQNKVITNWEQVPIIFDVPLAARILGLTDQKIRKMCREGTLPAFKIGENSWRFNKAEFMKHIGARE